MHKTETYWSNNLSYPEVGSINYIIAMKEKTEEVGDDGAVYMEVFDAEDGSKNNERNENVANEIHVENPKNKKEQMLESLKWKTLKKM